MVEDGGVNGCFSLFDAARGECRVLRMTVGVRMISTSPLFFPFSPPLLAPIRVLFPEAVCISVPACHQTRRSIGREVAGSELWLFHAALVPYLRRLSWLRWLLCA